MSDARTKEIIAKRGRDAGKRFLLTEMDVMPLSSFVLRLVTSLRVDSYEDLHARLSERDEDKPPIDAIMKLLEGSNAAQVEVLIREALTTVQIAPDPQHPGAYRLLEAKDLREIGTLGEILFAFREVNFGLGA